MEINAENKSKKKILLSKNKYLFLLITKKDIRQKKNKNSVTAIPKIKDNGIKNKITVKI